MAKATKKAEVKEEGLFERPKTPHEVLEEILKEFGVNELFIRHAVRRSERIGGIHPTDLVNMLINLRSGVKSRAEAEYIAEEYYHALMNEQRKAERMGVRVSYPIEFRREAGFGPAMPLGFEERGIQPPSIRPRYTYGRQTWSQPQAQPMYGVQPQYGQPLTEQRVIELVDKIMRRREEERRIDQLERELTNLRAEIDRKLTELVADIREALSSRETPPDMVTKKDLELMQKETQLRYLEDRLKLERELSEAERNRIKNEIERLREEVNRLRTIEGWKSDAYRFAHAIVRDTTEYLREAQPLKTALKVAVGGVEERPPRRVPAKSTLAEKVPPEYLEE